MATLYPGAQDNGTTLPNPNATGFTNNPDHAGLHGNENGAIIAIQSKLGTSASTPTLNQLLVGTGAGTSTWSKTAPTGTIVGTTDAQALTNKTITGGTITNAAVVNPTLTVDAVTGFTTSNTGSVYGVTVTLGTIGSAALAAGSVTATKIGTDSSFAWTGYTPTIGATSGTITTSSSSGRYSQIGKTVIATFLVTITTNGTGAGAVTATLPVTAQAVNNAVGTGRAYSVSNKALQAINTTTSLLQIFNYDNTYPGANGETLKITVIYEAA